MFKLNLFPALLLIGALTFTSCGNDEPEIPDNGNGTEVPTPTPDKQEKNEVTVYSDGSTSTGVPFRRIDDTTFWLNYIKYSIVSGHIVVADHDCIELEHTLHGEVEIYSAITIDDNKYPVRGISQWARTNCVDYHTYDAPYCKNLKKITLPNSIVSFSRSLFSGCINLTEISLPNSITQIPVSCFNSCESLEEITFTDKVTSIGEYAFSGCRLLKSIPLSNNITSIGKGAFRFCESLDSIKIPDSIKLIPSECFSGCKNLRIIQFPDSNVKFACYTGYSTIYHCTVFDDTELYWIKPLRLIGYGDNIWVIRTWKNSTKPLRYEIYVAESMHPEDCIGHFDNMIHNDFYNNFYHPQSSCDINHLLSECNGIYVPESSLEEYRTILSPHTNADVSKLLKGYDPETFDFKSLLD